MMEKRRFRIISNTLVAERTMKIILRSCEPGYRFSGEFVSIALDGFYLRRPFSVCDTDGDSITLIYKIVGEGTSALAKYCNETEVELLTGLGNGFDTSKCKSSALIVGGGLGIAPLYHLTKKLKAEGKKTTVVLGYNKASELFLNEDFAKICNTTVITTADGSVGTKGFVTDAIGKLQGNYDFLYTCGPMVMMKAVCGMVSIPGEASLEERMGCGAGYCYGCSIQTTIGAKRVCKDGPVFNKEEIIW